MRIDYDKLADAIWRIARGIPHDEELAMLRAAFEPPAAGKQLTEIEAHRHIIRDLVMLLDETSGYCNCTSCHSIRKQLFPQMTECGSYSSRFAYPDMLT